MFSQDPWEQLNGQGGPEDSDSPVDNVNSGDPLVEGGNPAWNPFLQFVPEDRRSEAANVLRDWDKSYQTVQEKYKPWEDLSKQGIDPNAAITGVQLLNLIDTQPQVVYETLKNYLEKNNLLPAGEPMPTDSIQEEGDNQNLDELDPKLQKLEQQVQVLAQIALAQKEEKERQQQDQAVEKELTSLRKKVGDFPEEEILMRMSHYGLSAEEAYKKYMGHVEEIRKRRPAPTLLGAGSTIPSRNINPTKLSEQETRSLVTDYLKQSFLDERGG